MKTNHRCLWLFSALLSTLPFGETYAQLAQPAADTVLHSPVLKELLSGKLELFEILYQEEAALWQTRLRKQPNDPKLLFETARALMLASGGGVLDEQPWLEAKNLLSKCVGHDPNNLTAWRALYEWNLNEHNFVEARKCLQKTQLLGAKQQDVETSTQILNRVEARHKNEKHSVPPRKLIRHDNRLLHERRPINHEALSTETKSLLQRLQANRTDAKSWHELAKSLLQEQSQPSDSMKLAAYYCLTESKKQNSNNIEVREMLAGVYKKHGASDLMKEECRGILEVDPNNVTAHMLLNY